jgi:hypothetical protein
VRSNGDILSRSRHLVSRQWRTEGGLGGSTPPPPKFRGFEKAGPKSQFLENTSVTT